MARIEIKGTQGQIIGTIKSSSMDYTHAVVAVLVNGDEVVQAMSKSRKGAEKAAEYARLWAGGSRWANEYRKSTGHTFITAADLARDAGTKWAAERHAAVESGECVLVERIAIVEL